MGRIVKGYWDCNSCNTKKIDGLVDICPNCGKQKSQNVRYYMSGDIEYVSDAELEKAKINKEHCDGEHSDWICNYCNQLNNYSDECCVACGSPKTEATHSYNTLETVDADLTDSIEENNVTKNILKTNPFKTLGIILAASLCIFALVFMFYPIKEETSIVGFSWDRVITIEEERTVKENGWSVPRGGRVYDEKEEFKEYINVVDHYETVSETKTRQVLSHYETTYTYRDNGNGTFTEVPHRTPVYKTETYIDTHQEPVYRKEAVYDTKYYYEIEKWFKTKNYQTSGSNHEAYWDTTYTLKRNERDTLRSEVYHIHYNNGNIKKSSYSDWMNADIGDKVIITRNRLGIVYSQKTLS